MTLKIKLTLAGVGLIALCLVGYGVVSHAQSAAHTKAIQAETRAQEAIKQAEALRIDHAKAKAEIQDQAKVIASKQQIADSATAKYRQLAQTLANQPSLPPAPPECVEAVKPYQEALERSKQALDAASDAIIKLEQSDHEKSLQITKLTLDNQTLEKMANQYMAAASSYKVALDAERSAAKANGFRLAFRNLTIGFGLGAVAGYYAGRR